MATTNQNSVIDKHTKRERNLNITLKGERKNEKGTNKNYKNNQKIKKKWQ